MKNVAIIGSGSWGMALAICLANNGNNVKVWSFCEEERDLINNEKKCKFLPEAQIPENIECTTSFEEAIKGADFILHVTPSKFTRETFNKYKQYVGNTPVIICSKGFEKDTLQTLDEVIKDELPDAKVGVLTGPSHAEEVALGVPTVLVVASEHEEIFEMIQDAFMSNKMRIYTSKDVKGLELGGALKNIIAFGAGICDGLGLGDNSKAALMTRGIREISRLGVAMGADASTFSGLSGIGDLIVTCTSMHSRNRRAGILIGQGKSLEETLEEVKMVVEGITATEVAYEVSKKLNVDMPITSAIYSILHSNLNPNEVVIDLMMRNKTHEMEEIVSEKLGF